MQKTYQFTILLGIETDTLDTLGLVKNDIVPDYNCDDLSSQLENSLSNFTGKVNQPYPPYSSAR